MRARGEAARRPARIPGWLAAAAALALGCAGAGAGGAGRDAAAKDRPAAYALPGPEPDPSCRAMAYQASAPRPLDAVTVVVSVQRDGKARVLRFVTPDLTPAQQLEVRAACERCAWRPAVDGNGQPVEREATIVFGARE